MYQKYIKRGLDIIISLVVIFVLWPLLLVIAFLVRIKLGKPVLFSQVRPGYKGKLFKLYKFRTMTNTCDEFGNLLPTNERTTTFGSILRSTSLDELPEIVINVLRGEMSLIGPRPLAQQYLPYYTPEEMRRHDVLPGLTGLAQVYGRNNLSWEKRFEYDIKYVDHISFKMDMSIFIQTLLKIVKRSDIIDTRKGCEENFDVYRKRQNGRK